MPDLDELQVEPNIKAVIMGISGTGKTGALASLAHAGFQLRIMDFDQGLPVLKSVILDPKSSYDPACIKNVKFLSFSETFTAAGGKAIPTSANSWTRAMMALENWADGDFKPGKITTWSPKDILVLDTLTFASRSALFHVQAMNSRLGHDGSGFQGQADIGRAQDLIKGLLDMIKSSAVKCHVLVNSHIVFTNENGGKPMIKMDDKGKVTSEDAKYGFPQALGRALSPHIGEYFNTMLEFRKLGEGPAAETRLYTKTQGVTLCKNTAPFAVQDSYPLKSGLADYFKAIGATP